MNRKLGRVVSAAETNGSKANQANKIDVQMRSVGMDSQSPVAAFFFLPFFLAALGALAGVTWALFGVGMGALIVLRQASILSCRAFVFSGISFARFLASPMSSRRLYSSNRPSSKNSINFQSPV